MKVKINQLDEQVNESNTDFKNQQLKKENDQLRQLVNKYHEAKNTSRKSVDLKTKKVKIKSHVQITYIGTYVSIT